MQNMGLLMEYEDILLKKRKDFSAIKKMNYVTAMSVSKCC